MVDLTLKNDKNMSFTVNCEDNSSSFEAFKKWVGAHCSIISSSSKELVIKDSEANARLRGCRMFAQKKRLDCFYNRIVFYIMLNISKKR